MPSSSRFLWLDAARGIAALGVLAVHVESAPREIVGWGVTWVEFFFVLSGFVLCSPLLKIIETKDQSKQRKTRWMVSRLIRFWVVLLPALMLVFSIEVFEFWRESNNGEVGIEKSLFPDQILAWIGAALFLQVVWSSALDWHGPAWSLSVELFVNTVAIGADAAKFKSRIFILCSMGLFLSLFSEAIVNLWPNILGNFLIKGFGLGMLGFFCGILAKLWWDLRQLKVSVLPGLVLTLSLISLMYFNFFFFPNIAEVLNCLVSVPLVLTLASINQVELGRKTTSIFTFLGATSFGVYLFHSPVILLIDWFLAQKLHWAAFVLVAAALSSMVSYLNLRCIEQILRNKLDKALNR